MECVHVVIQQVYLIGDGGMEMGVLECVLVGSAVHPTSLHASQMMGERRWGVLECVHVVIQQVYLIGDGEMEMGALECVVLVVTGMYSTSSLGVCSSRHCVQQVYLTGDGGEVLECVLVVAVA